MFVSRFKMLTAATLAVGSMVAFSGVANAQATPIAPAQIIAPPPTVAPFGGTLLSSSSSAFNFNNDGNIITGRLLSAVFSGGTAQAGGFGGSALDFYYQVVLDAGSSTTPGGSQIVQNISISSFATITTAVAQTASDIDGGGTFTTGTVAANAAQRTGIATLGAAMIFDFGQGVPVGAFSNAVIVRTTTTSFDPTGSAGIQGAGVAANTAASVVAPISTVAAPEPGSVALFAMGLMTSAGVAVRRRRSAIN